ncbi:unnamed protein product [Rotaria sp. Silwood1]|nr:unnamed protein product [Rotaria sp. Silwood1]CAF3611923.1 unnamed protein product [Rotaria sp. Silwood1]CAF3647345.1 unnamed protein product [Rotaria sp. Silwood1]CAF3679960.1 unnamed protein product [Rotaria sp. Silwood1]CAF4682016.1 unnamed protein product [Rotaria sp. Silwood1]
MNISLQNRITINISGVRFETFKSTLEVYPNTLLGNAKRRKYYYDNVLDEYFFDRHRGCFEAILYYYQSKGRLRRPNSVPLDTFLEEITFFDLGHDALAQVRKDENLKEVEKTQLPRNRCRRYIWATMEYPEFSFIAKLFNILSLIIILISTVTLAVESLPQYAHLSEDACQKQINQNKIGMNNGSMNLNDVQSNESTCLLYFSSPFHRIQVICIGFFTLELILRLLSTPSLSKYFKSFMNWIDIVAVIPFYINLILNLVDQLGNQNTSIYNSLALLRVLRCARIFKFYRVFKNIKTIRVLAVTVKESMPDFLVLAVTLTLMAFLFGAAVYLIESTNENSVFDSIPKATYWGIVTITSVGYGDLVPVTALGRLTAMLCALTGVGTIGMLVSVLVDRYQRVYTRKLYIKPEQIVFNDYSDEENEDLETGHGNSCTDPLIVSTNDKNE